MKFFGWFGHKAATAATGPDVGKLTPGPRADSDRTMRSTTVDDATNPCWREMLRQFDVSLLAWVQEVKTAIAFEAIEVRIFEPGTKACLWMATNVWGFDVDVSHPSADKPEGYFGAYVTILKPGGSSRDLPDGGYSEKTRASVAEAMVGWLAL